MAASGAALPPRDSPYMGKCISCLGFLAGGSLGTDIMSDISTCNAVFLKEALEKLKGFDERLKYGTEDTDLSRRMKESGHGIKIVPTSYVFHKTRGGLEFLKWCHRGGEQNFIRARTRLLYLAPSMLFGPVLGQLRFQTINQQVLYFYSLICIQDCMMFHYLLVLPG